jgi:zinc transport system substrate-binding protein
VKKYLCLILAVIFAALCLIGFGVEDIDAINDDDKLDIVCTTFPQYDWVSNIIKGNEENINLVLLMEKGGDLHNFQPSALDIARVSGCDILIYVGGESDTWVNDALKEAVNQNLVAINMMEAMEGYGSLYEEQHFEEIQELGHHHDKQDEHDDEYDEHIWLSLRNAVVLNEYICQVMSEVDGENATLYRNNCDKYVSELLSLDSEYMDAVEHSENDTLLFADRFPFRYMIEDYGLCYYAAFEGCSAETEASFNTVAYLSDKLSELQLHCVSIIDGSNDRLARVIIENSNSNDSKIAVFNSMQSVSKNDINKGVTYISIMRDNLETLKQALQ